MNKTIRKIVIAVIALITIVSVSGITPAQFTAGATAPTAQILAELQTQIRALMDKVAALQAQLNRGIPPTPTPTLIPVFNFTRTLALGSRGEDVRALQQFLNAQGFIITTAGPGSIRNESIRFGPRTRTALMRFQRANNISPANGIFNLVTRTRVMEIMALTPAPITPAPPANGIFEPTPRPAKWWDRLIPDIRTTLGQISLGVSIETSRSLSIKDEKDITGDGIPEALVDLGTGGAGATFISTLMRIENDKPVVAQFRQKDGKISSLTFSDGVAMMGGTNVIMLPDKNAIYSGSWRRGQLGDLAECSVEAYQWNSQTKNFDFNLNLSNEIRPEYCQMIKRYHITPISTPTTPASITSIRVPFIDVGASSGLGDRLRNDPDALRRAFETGEIVGCGDRIVYVTKEIPATTQPLNAIYRQLFATVGSIPFEGRQLINSIESHTTERSVANFSGAKPLRFVRAEIQGNVAMVYLEGNIFGVGTCHEPRVSAQIILAARQFPNILSVRTFLNGTEFSWERWMDQRG